VLRVPSAAIEQDHKDLEFTPYFGDADASQEAVFGDLFDFEARQRTIDAGPPAVAAHRRRRFKACRDAAIEAVVSAAVAEQAAAQAPSSSSTLGSSLLSKQSPAAAASSSSSSSSSSEDATLEPLIGPLAESLVQLAESFGVTFAPTDLATLEVCCRGFRARVRCP
jgi:hypothetical protein